MGSRFEGLVSLIIGSPWRVLAAIGAIFGLHSIATSGLHTIIPITNTETAIEFRLVEIRDILNGVTFLFLALICLLVDLGDRLLERGKS